jgi:site-specific DNA-cytosine methylase
LAVKKIQFNFMRILVAFEESQAVCKELRALGHEAYSCDLLPCSGGHPEWHLQKDVRSELPLSDLNTISHGLPAYNRYDLVIAFPPCTDLAVSGSRWFEKKRLSGEQKDSIELFFYGMVLFSCSRKPDRHHERRCVY